MQVLLSPGNLETVQLVCHHQDLVREEGQMHLYHQVKIKAQMAQIYLYHRVRIREEVQMLRQESRQTRTHQMLMLEHLVS
jgi:hypothetical protein